MAGIANKNGSKIKVLLFAANPMQKRLQLDEEIRSIEEKIRQAEHRDFLELIAKLAVRTDDLLQNLNMYQPQIVHFSAHGRATGEIILVDRQGLPKPVSPPALKALFTTLKDNIRVVVLNACFSKIQAEALAEVIDCVIGMNDAIGDEAAILFSASFYRAIGFGLSVQKAFEQGIVAIQLEGVHGARMPELLVRAGVNPSAIVILNPEVEAAKQAYDSLLHSAKNALQRGDYDSARRNIEKFLEIVDYDAYPEKAAEAKYLQAIVLLEGKRPSSQKLSVIRSVENLLHNAIGLHCASSYLVMLAMCKQDFARNGYPQFLSEAQGLWLQVKRITPTPNDMENFRLLTICQPNLTKDYS